MATVKVSADMTPAAQPIKMGTLFLNSYGNACLVGKYFPDDAQYEVFELVENTAYRRSVDLSELLPAGTVVTLTQK